MENKEQMQESQYSFPYHHLAHIKDDGIYIFRHLFWGLEHVTYINFVIEKIKSHNPKSIVDIGCGEGRIISELAKNFSSNKLTGYDISKKAIGFAQAFVPSANFETHDIVDKPLSTKHDCVVSCEVIEHIKPEEVTTYCKNIANSLNKDGYFYLTTPTTNIPTNKKHYQHFTKESLEVHLSPFFEIEEVDYLNCENAYSKFLNRLIANRFYISNSKMLNKLVLNEYNKRVLKGNEKTGSRIYIKAKKK